MRIRRSHLQLAFAVAAWVAAFHPCRGHAATLDDIDRSVLHEQWSDAAEIAFEILRKDPGNDLAKLKGAYALFQKGYSNAALLLLKRIPPSEWGKLPQGQDRFAEIVLLFQKKVPLNLLPGRLDQVNAEQAAAYLANELKYTQGRDAFEQGDLWKAKTLLTDIAKSSRYYAQARYLLAAIAVKRRDYATASAELSRVFEPAVLDQASEFWADVGAQETSHWGANLKVILGPDILRTEKNVQELSLLGLARVEYAKQDFAAAIRYYDRVPESSPNFPRATLEKVWALMSMDKHDEAESVARKLSVDEETFEAVEARVIRAIVLTDNSRTDEARDELREFQRIYKSAQEAVAAYRARRWVEALPAFMKADLNEDARIDMLRKYQAGLRAEIDSMQGEDLRLFPAFARWAEELAPLLAQARKLEEERIEERLSQRLADLDRIFAQAKLVHVETLLEDREKMRAEFSKMGDISEAKQKEHDDKLVKLLSESIAEVDEASEKSKKSQPELDFRQSELLWELSTAKAVADVGKGSSESEQEVRALRERAIRLADEIVRDHPKFEKHSDALFFTGFARVETGQPAQGLRILDAYVKKYPQGSYAADAYRIMADAEFDANRFARAEELFKKILAFPESPIVGYALYKIGWCAYNQKNFAQTLLAFEEAILWAGVGERQGQTISLRREAKHDLITVYAEVGDYRKAVDYFKRFYKGVDTSWIAALAKAYDQTGQYEKSAYLYKSLIDMDPGSNENIHYQAALVAGAYQLRKWPLVLEEARRLVDGYRAGLEEPPPAPEAGTEGAEGAQGAEEHPARIAEKAIRDTMMAQLFEFKSAEVGEAFERIKALNELYLSVFGKWPESQEPLYRHALFLVKMKRMSDAIEAFRLHWERFGDKLKEPLREEALRNLVYALENRESDRKKVEPDAPLSPDAADIAKYSLEYEKLYPMDKRARTMAFLRTALLFKYHQLEQGIAESQKLFDANPADETASKAFKNLRVAYYETKDWDRVFKWATELASRADPMMKPYLPDLKSIREETLFLLADQTKDDAKASELYLQISQDPDMRRLRDKSLYNAFVRYQRTDRKMEALAAAQELERQNPRYEGLASIAGVRSAYYQEAGDYARAYPLLKSFLGTKDKSVPPEALQQARLNAGLIAEGLDQPTAALEFFRELVSRAPAAASPGVPEARRGIQRIESRLNPGPPASYPGWEKLVKLKERFEKSPLPPGKELAARIQSGASRLESTAKKFLDVSQSMDTPTKFAMEAYCAVPLFYDAYARAVVALGKKDEDLTRELKTVAQPIEAKADELAGQCLSKAEEILHDGPWCRATNARWGWAKNEELVKSVDRLLKYVENGFPWLDPADTDDGEPAILDAHLQGKGTLATWYALAKARFDQGKLGLSRLTLIDTLIHHPESGKAQNALAAIDHLRAGPDASSAELAASYVKAANAGSVAAWANLAYVQLKAGHLPPALPALRKASSEGVFDKFPELKALISETKL